MHTGIDPTSVSDWLGNAKAALDLIKTARGFIPQGQKRDELDASIRDAEGALARSDAALANQLGYNLCQCSFPPRIMLWREREGAYVCSNEQCGRTVNPARSTTQPAAKIPLARVCPLCQAEMKVVAESPHPDFGFAGVKVHSMACTACGNKVQRNFDPSKGYGK